LIERPVGELFTVGPFAVGPFAVGRLLALISKKFDQQKIRSAKNSTNRKSGLGSANPAVSKTAKGNRTFMQLHQESEYDSSRRSIGSD